MKIKVAILSGIAVLLVVGMFIVAVFVSGNPNEVKGPGGRIAKLERHEFSSEIIRYTYPPGAQKPDFSYLSPAFRGEKLLSAEFSWQVGPTYPRLAAALHFARKEVPSSWSNFWTGYPRAMAIRVSAADELGNEFDPVVQHAGAFEKFNSREYSVEDVDVFPRRGKTVHLRLLDNGNLLADFTLPNPAAGPHPEWTAQPLPITQSNSDLEVALTGFRAIHPRKNSGKNERTECVFNLREDGHATLAWAPVSFEISDATGNHWKPPETVGANPFPVQSENASIQSQFLGALWPGESAWKFRCEFKRIADFPKSDLLEIAHIAIPDSGAFSEPHTRYEFNGATVEVAGVIGKDADRQQFFSRKAYLLVNAEQRRGCVTVALGGNILSKHRRLTFVSATDDQGRELKLAGFEQPGDPKWVPYSLVFQPQAGAREINLVVAISESRIVEFLAKPEQIHE